MKKLIAITATLGLLAPAALAASSHYVRVSPGSVSAGSNVHVYGSVGRGCSKGSRVTIYSKAFKGSTRHNWAGVPAIFATVAGNHRFSTHVTINSSTPAAKYSVGARCGGGTLGHTSLTVTPSFY